MSNLGIAYKALGETQRAIDYYEQALAIDREVGNRLGEAADLGNLGNAYVSLGEPHRAIELLEECLSIQRERNNRLPLSSNYHENRLWDMLGASSQR